MIFGFTLFHYLLKPCPILCKILQNDEISVVGAIEAVLKTSKAVTKEVLSRIQHTGDDGRTYQGAQVGSLEEDLAYLKHHKNDFRGCP